MADELENQPELPKINKKKSPGGAIWAILIIFILGCLLILLPIGILGFSIFTIGEKAAQIVTSTPVSIPDWPAAFSEDFGKATGSWQTKTFTGKDYEDTRSIERGKYVWKVSTRGGYVFYEIPKLATPKFDNMTDFYISVDAKHIEGQSLDGYGIFFRYTDTQYYYFMVREDQTFSISLNNLGEWKTLLNNGNASVLQPGEINTLGVLGQRNHYRFFINNVMVGEIEDNKILTGTVGLAIEPWLGATPQNPNQQGISYSPLINTYLKVEFDNFELHLPSRAALSTPEQFPPVKPNKGKIVFASNYDGNRNIYLINSDSSGLKQITNDPAEDYAPKWSPDGKKIAFVSDRDGNPEIYVMDPDGKNVTRLTNNPGDDFSPDWSPDGKKIVFVSVRDNKHDLFIMDSDAGDKSLFQLTNKKEKEDFPCWSIDQNTITFQVASTENTLIHIINDDGKKQKILLDYENSSQPGCSSDGKSIVYIYELPLEKSIIEIYNLEIQEFIEVIETLNHNKFPTWSPDGNQIIFVSDRDGQFDLYVMPTDGNGMFRLTRNDAVEESPDWFSAD